ncbi:MAG: hypothetical protein GF329_00520 [Candidatus Lokiarchaeota archaeon]|nr:hypothetical protein [Candidatus Lokiarchaeota archaeon]
MNIVIRGEILHILLSDNVIHKMIFDRIEDRNEHQVEVHLDKNNHIVSLIITDIKFDVANIKNLIRNIKTKFSKTEDIFPSEELTPIIKKIEKDKNIRFRINRV